MKNPNNRSPKRAFIEGIITPVILFLFGVFGIFFNYERYNYLPQKADLVTITEPILNKPKISDGGKMSDFIEFHLSLAPEFSFKIIGFGFDATRTKDLIENVKKGDTLELEIERSEYLKKIEGHQKLSWYDRIGWNTINIHGLRKGNDVYLKFDDYNKKELEYAKETIPFAVILLLAGFIWAILVIRKYRKAKRI